MYTMSRISVTLFSLLRLYINDTQTMHALIQDPSKQNNVNS